MRKFQDTLQQQSFNNYFLTCMTVPLSLRFQRSSAARSVVLVDTFCWPSKKRLLRGTYSDLYNQELILIGAKTFWQKPIQLLFSAGLLDY